MYIVLKDKRYDDIGRKKSKKEGVEREEYK